MLQLKGIGGKEPDIITTPIMKFRGGVNKLLSESRIATDEAREAQNLQQVEDGLWKPRGGTAYYGQDLGATCDGASEYLKSDGTTELIAVAGTKVYKSTDGGAWTEITGATYTAGLQCYFMQIASYLYIANGTDKLGRYNGTTIEVYTALTAPTNVAASRTTLTSGTYTMYCEATALNAVGETVGSTEASVTLNRVRDNWTASDSITWTCSAVANATAYTWYISEVAGQEEWVGTSEKPSFVDDGTAVINPYVVPPLGNTTEGPKFKSMCVSGNRIWATNDPSQPYMVYFSGSGREIGNFSDFYGGGWINLEKGGRETPVAVKHYQSGSGDGRATVLCKTPEGQGAVWQLLITTATVGTETFSIPNAVKVVGSSGTDSVMGVVATNNDIMFPNKRGWFSLGPEKNYYGILRTNEISSRIRPYWRGIVGSQFSKVAAYFRDAKVYISVATAGTSNNRVIIYDLERMNWTVEWTMSVSQFLEYTDTTGVSRLLFIPVDGTQLVQYSDNIQGDLGLPFTTSYYSGRWSVGKFFKDFTKVNKVYLKLNSPRGVINFEILGTEKSKAFSSLASTAIYASSTSNTGFGYDLLADIEMGDSDGVPTFFSDSAIQRFAKIKKKLRDIQFHITTNTVDADYTLLGIIVEGNVLKVNSPTSERMN